MLDAFAARPVDGARVRRLLLGVSAGVALVFGLGRVLAFFSTAVMAAPPEEDEGPVVPVALVETPEEQPAEPEVEPETNADPGPRAPGPAPPPMPTDVPPEVKEQNAHDAYGDGDKPISFGSGGSGRGGGGGKKVEKKEEKKEEPKPKAKKPVLSPEEYDPPKCKLAAIDRRAAKSLGVEGSVAVKFRVTESGAITDVAVVSGPAELHALAIAAVQKSKCEPARLKADGSAIPMTKRARFPVRFSTE
jgi:protein TonB